MSSATAVRPQAEASIEGLVEGPPTAVWPFEETAPETEKKADEQAWIRLHQRLLAPETETDLQMKFARLADELEEAAAAISATRRARKLAPFNEILALGDEAIPEVLERLKTSDNRPLWLRMLGTLTPFPPGAGKETIDDATAEWIQWGRLAH